MFFYRIFYGVFPEIFPVIFYGSCFVLCSDSYVLSSSQILSQSASSKNPCSSASSRSPILTNRNPGLSSSGVYAIQNPHCLKDGTCSSSLFPEHRYRLLYPASSHGFFREILIHQHFLSRFLHLQALPFPVPSAPDCHPDPLHRAAYPQKAHRPAWQASGSPVP